MRTSNLLQFPLLLLSLGAVLSGCTNTVAKAELAKEDRKIDLLIYSDDFAQIQETRDITLSKGKSRIGIQNISGAMDQNSVVYSWPDSSGVSTISSTYELGTKDSSRLLQRFLGREIELVYRSESGQEGQRQPGILEVAEPGNIVVRVNDKLIVNPIATIEVPATSGVVTMPQLSAEVESGKEQKTKLGFSYLSRGISWTADYTATLTPDDNAMKLECWATVTNTTGTEFPDANLSFVAGSPNRAVTTSEDVIGGFPRKMKGMSFEYGANSSAYQRNRYLSIGELYAFPYSATATIRPNQMNRIRLMEAKKVTIKRVYAIRLPDESNYGSLSNPNRKLPATLSVKFTNSKEVGLGTPLPSGAMRVFEPNSGGNATYIGASTIGNTPANASVNATLSEVFDIYALHRQTALKKLDRKSVAKTFETVIHNEKSVKITVRVVQSFYDQWKMISESLPSTRSSASSAQWSIPVPAGGTVKLTYQVRILE